MEFLVELAAPDQTTLHPAAPVSAAATRSVSFAELLEILPHRAPFLFLDSMEDLVDGVSGVGIKTVCPHDPYIQGLSPGGCVLPGAILVEAMAQTAIVIAATAADNTAAGVSVALRSMFNIRFRKPVVGGDRLRLHCSWDARRGPIWRGWVDARVGPARVAQAGFTAMLVPKQSADQPARPAAPPPDPRIATIIEILARETHLDPAALTPATRFDSLPLAWLDLLPAIYAMEMAFGVELPMTDLRDHAACATVDDLVRHVIATLRANTRITA